MSTATIEVTGMAEIRQRLSPANLTRALQRGLRAGLVPAAAAAAALAPRRTGRLASSIRATVGSRRAQAVGAIVTGEPYGHLVEHGHRIVTGGRVQRAGRFTPLSKIGRFRGTVTGQVPPHPFAGPAFLAHEAELVTAIEQSLKATIERADA